MTRPIETVVEMAVEAAVEAEATPVEVVPGQATAEEAAVAAAEAEKAALTILPPDTIQICNSVFRVTPKLEQLQVVAKIAQ
ncbi:hypothetical protein BGZ81_003804, partial [Podila clonocystis]